MSSNSNELRFELKFDGKALTDHSMDLDLFIESLNGLNGLLSEINKDPNDENGKNLNAYEIKIHIPDRQNCFLYELLINAGDQINNLDAAIEFLKNLGLIDIGKNAVINLIKKYKGTKIPTEEKEEIDPKIVALYENKEFQLSLFKFYNPLKKKDIKFLEIKYKDKTVQITKEEITPFLEYASAELISNDLDNKETKIYEIELSPLRINFDKDYWEFKSKNKKIYKIDIVQTELHNSDNNFSKKDLYKVELEETNEKDDEKGKDKHSYKMLKILEKQKHTDSQQSLDI